MKREMRIESHFKEISECISLYIFFSTGPIFLWWVSAFTISSQEGSSKVTFFLVEPRVASVREHLGLTFCFICYIYWSFALIMAVFFIQMWFQVIVSLQVLGSRSSHLLAKFLIYPGCKIRNILFLIFNMRITFFNQVSSALKFYCQQVIIKPS